MLFRLIGRPFESGRNLISKRSFCSSLPSTPEFKFEVIYQSKKSRARVGRIHTPHGIIETPNFVPVATNATMKSIENQMSLDSGFVFLLFTQRSSIDVL